MADMEDLFGSDADSDAERKGGVAWASREGRVARLLRPEPDRGPVPGLRTLRRYVRGVALLPLLPQRPLQSRRYQLPQVFREHAVPWQCVERRGKGAWCRGAGAEPGVPL